MPIADLSTARAELHQLQHVRVALGETLAQHAARLKSVGALPPEELVNQLLDYRTRLISLSAGLNDSQMVSSAAETSGGLTLDDLKSEIDYQEARGNLEQVMGSILQLGHIEDPAFAALASCQGEASQILALARGPKAKFDTSKVAETVHSFQALLSLIQSDSELSDELWAACQEEVNARWGRMLSTAVARGKIRFTGEPTLSVVSAAQPNLPVVPAAAISAQLTPPPVPPACEVEFEDASAIDSEPGIVLVTDDDDDVDTPAAIHGTESEAAVPEAANSRSTGNEGTARETTESETTESETVLDTQHDMIFDAVGKPGLERHPSRSYRSNELKMLTAESYQWLKPEAASPIVQKANESTDAIAGLARRALQADPSNRGTLIAELIQQLLQTDCYGAAFHLARSVEGQLPKQSFAPPTWLLRALVLSRHVCYSHGEIGRLIESDLEQFQPALVTTGQPDDMLAMGFLVRAAALLPALLTTSPAAGKIISTFRISPGLSHLYNYCGRISNYGQQLQGQAADLFTPDCDTQHWNAEVTQLQGEVERWLPETVNRHCGAVKSSQFFLRPHWTLLAASSVRYELAAQKWSKWQEAFRIVQRLLKPVRTADHNERNWLKAEVERLTNAVRLESANQPFENREQAEVLLFPDEAMVTVIREAIDFANRWLRLCAARPDQGRTLIGREAEILRDEILERTDGVIAELAAFSQEHDTPCVTAAIACLCRTIEHLRLIFSPHSTLPLREPAALELIRRELSDIPDVEFDRFGMPLLNMTDLEAVLLTHLSGASPDEYDNLEHRVTARILEANLRQREQQQAAMKPCAAEISDSCWE